MPWAARIWVAGLLPGLLGACYSYRPLPTTPAPETRVSLLLNDVGRVETAKLIGPSTERVDGNVLAASDTAYLVSVASVKPLRGAWIRWNGEEVTLRRDHVAILYERRLAKGRTALFAGGVAFLVLTAMVNLDILGFGALDIPLIPGADGDPGDQ